MRVWLCEIDNLIHNKAKNNINHSSSDGDAILDALLGPDRTHIIFAIIQQLLIAKSL